MKGKLFLSVAFAILPLAGQVSGQAPPPAPGPYVPLAASEVASLHSYGPSDRLVAAYYFYWYKWKDACVGDACDPAYARDHIQFATGVHSPTGPTDALTDRPPNLEAMDYSDPEWHRKELEAMTQAGIDLVLPVFWGVPGRYGEDGHHVARWSLVGLQALVKALDGLREEGRPYPKVGMFYDTSTLAMESPFHYENGQPTLDLTTSSGQSHFYTTIRDFFSIVPPRYWAMWENRPLVWLYSSSFAASHDSSIFQDSKNRFAADCQGLEPQFVAHVDWECGADDWVYRWGGAIQPSYLSINAIGPGFDNSGALGKPRGSHVLRKREDGAFYRDGWERALRTKNPITAIETWNELHEGTEIRPTVEYGNEYSNITREYAERFKSKNPVPSLPGPFSESDSVSWKPDLPLFSGLEPVAQDDGQYREILAGTETVLETQSPYVYFAVDDSFRFAATGELETEVEVFDLPERVGTIRVEYDSWDREGTQHGIYRSSVEAPLTGTFAWRKVSLPMPMLRLSNNQNGGADFRVVAPKGLRIRSVSVRASGAEETR